MASATITINGNVGKDPEKASTKNGHQLVRFSVAVNRGKDKPPMWFNVTAWDERPRELAGKLHKGSGVVVTGSFNLREYDGNNGKATSLDVTALSIDFASGTKREEGQEATRAPAPRGDAPPPASDDDIPF